MTQTAPLNSNSPRGRLEVAACFLIFSYMVLAIVVPYARMREKFVIVALFCMIQIIQLSTTPEFRKELLPSKELIGVFFSCLAAGAFGILYGWPEASEGSFIYIAALYVGYPICAFVMVILGRRFLSADSIDVIFLCTLSIICAHFLLMLLVRLQVLPDISIIRDPLFTSDGRYQSFLTLTCAEGLKVYSNAISSLTFLVPFAFIRALGLPPFSVKWTLASACSVGGILCLYLSGRSGALLGFGCASGSALIILIVRKAGRKVTALFTVGLIGLTIASCLWLIAKPLVAKQCHTENIAKMENGPTEKERADSNKPSVQFELPPSNQPLTDSDNNSFGNPNSTELEKLIGDGYIDRVIERVLRWAGAFDRSGIRVPQAQVLISGFLEAPFFGHGSGTVASMIRDPLHPWRYELSYFALLYHNGLVGFLVYATCVGWIFIRGAALLRIDRSTSVLALLGGLLAMLVAYATNPYFDAFDILWTIFIPAMFVDLFARLPTHAKHSIPSAVLAA